MAELSEKIERLRQRYRAFPDSKAFAPLADLLRRDGQVEEALVLLEEGLALHPDYMTAMVILGHTLLDTSRSDHARKVLVKVMDLDPDNFVALRLLALDAFQNEIWHLALPWLEHLVELEPHDTAWPEMLARARSEAAGDAPETSAPKAGTDEFATMTMVEIFIEQGYFTKALAALKLIQSRQPGQSAVKLRLAEVLGMLDEQRERKPSGEFPAVRGPDNVRDRTRGQEMAAMRAREKKRFSEWIDGIQPREGNSS